MVKLILIFLLSMIATCIFLLIKNENTFENHVKIGDAIFRYRIDMIKQNNYNFEVDYNDIEPYDKTLLRLLDFGYTNILPKEKFEIIEKYIVK